MSRTVCWRAQRFPLASRYNYRHRAFPEIYAVWVAVALPPMEETPVPVNFPKTGHMQCQVMRVERTEVRYPAERRLVGDAVHPGIPGNILNCLD